MFQAIGRFSYRFRWLLIGVWIALFGVSVVAAPLLADVLTGTFANPDSPAERSGDLIQEKFNQGPTTLLIVFRSPDLEAQGSEFQAAQAAALEQLRAAGIPHLQDVQTFQSTGSTQLISQDGRSSVAVLNFDASKQMVQAEIQAIRVALSESSLETYVTGEAAADADLTTSSFRDLQRVELYGLPVALVALVFMFGSLVSAALPVVTGGLAVTVTLGSMYLLGRATSMSIFAMNTATLLGLAVAIDYALFMVWRFREELHRGASVAEAVEVTVARAGRSVFFSGIAVMVGVVGLMFFPSPGLRSLGIGGLLVVFFSVAASLTFMPALMGVLGRRVNAVPVIRLHAAHEGRLAQRWARLLLRRPWASILAGIAVAALLIAPAFTMKTQMTDANTLPAGAESRQGLVILDQEFDREALSPLSVMVTWEGDGSVDMGRAAGLFMYGQQLTVLPGVESVLSPFTLSGLSDPAALAGLWPQFQQLFNDPDGFAIPAEGISVAGQIITADQLQQFKQLVKASIAKGGVLFRVVSETPPSSPESRELVERILATDPGSDYQLHVAGESASSADFFNELSTWFPWVFVWVVLVSLGVFIILLRSLVLPVLAVIVNLFTIAMSYGCLVLIFQGDTFESLLRFTSSGAIDAVIPIVLLCILFGITMDYAVFMLTRMHERWDRTHDNRLSVVTGVVRTGRVIASAALLVVIVTGAFAFTSIAQTKMLGLGIAFAIIVDIILVRLTLLPAIMSYLGASNWWWPRRH